jgi:hypothetical protein
VASRVSLPTIPALGSGEALPIGFVFIAVVNTDPNTLLGYGTWASIGSGRVLVGVNASDSDFDAAEKTGGAKTVASTGTVAAPVFTGSALGTHLHGVGTYAVAAHAAHTHAYTEVPNHVHVQNAPTSASGGAVLYALDTNASGSTSAGISTANPTGGVASGTTGNPSASLTHTPSGSSEAVSAGTPAGTNNAPAYTGTASSVVQPFLCVYFWKRTA